MFTRIGTFLKPHIFYLDSCEWGFNPLWRAASKQCGFGVRIHWFRVGEGKRRMSVRNGMRHGLRNDIITQNVIYGKWRKEIN